MICGQDFVVKLVSLALKEFNLILSMDWMVKHEAIIDFLKIKIEVRDKNEGIVASFKNV